MMMMMMMTRQNMPHSDTWLVSYSLFLSVYFKFKAKYVKVWYGAGEVSCKQAEKIMCNIAVLMSCYVEC